MGRILFAEGSDAQLTVVSNFIDDSVQIGLKNDQNNGTLRTFKLTFPNSIATFTFSARIMGWNVSGISPNEALKLNFILKVSGDILES